jgi:F-type H+-transporting ATPase subunit alpha
VFAGNSGSLDDVPVNRVQAFENEFLQYMKDHKSALRNEIAEKKELTADMKKALTEAIGQFKVSFKTK